MNTPAATPSSRPFQLAATLRNSLAPLLRYLPGVIVTATLAWAATRLQAVPWLAAHGIGTLTLAILLGMLAGNTVPPRIAALSAAGVAFSKQTLLRLGIVLYGLRLTFQDVAHVGVAGVAIDASMLASTFTLATWFGPRVLGIDRRTAMLVGAGSSICGAAAVLATERVVRGKADQTAVAVATVVVFGTLAMFLYPALYRLVMCYHLIDASPTAYGIFAGSTIHEVAQVLVAGRAVGESAASSAVIAKMVRVLMLAPFLIALAARLRHEGCNAAIRDPASADGARHHDWLESVPWFAVGFAALAALNSCVVLPTAAVEIGLRLDGFILAMAMAALGVTTQLKAIRAAGVKPLLLAAVLFVWLLCGGFAINALIQILLTPHAG